MAMFQWIDFSLQLLYTYNTAIVFYVHTIALGTVIVMLTDCLLQCN